MTMLTPKENALAKKFLEEFASVLGNRSCNDWDFPEDWTEDERIEFCHAYHAWNGDLEDFDPRNPYLSDFSVASFLAHKLG